MQVVTTSALIFWAIEPFPVSLLRTTEYEEALKRVIVQQAGDETLGYHPNESEWHVVNTMTMLYMNMIEYDCAEYEWILYYIILYYVMLCYVYGLLYFIILYYIIYMARTGVLLGKWILTVQGQWCLHVCMSVKWQLGWRDFFTKRKTLNLKHQNLNLIWNSK
jgi:hypothetical protein